MHSADLSVARCRAVLSIAAALAVYADPGEQFGLPNASLAGGPSGIAIVLCLHLVYSLTLLFTVGRRRDWPRGVVLSVVAADLTFAIAVGMTTRANSSPCYVFAAFGLLTVALHWGLRRTVQVTAVAVACITAALFLAGVPSHSPHLVMSPVYLGILGCMVGYLGERRLRLERTLRELVRAAERAEVARDLHDDVCQAFAGMNLQLETCRRLVAGGRGNAALVELAQIQTGVRREYDQLRAYVRTLAGEEPRPAAWTTTSPHFALDLRVAGARALVEHVLLMAREALANAHRHAEAQTARIAARIDGGTLEMTIDDDGRGMPSDVAVPWSLASRVRALGGTVRAVRDAGPGVHLRVVAPVAGQARDDDGPEGAM